MPPRRSTTQDTPMLPASDRHTADRRTPSAQQARTRQRAVGFRGARLGRGGGRAAAATPLLCNPSSSVITLVVAAVGG